jgi:hypothetical protein
MFIFVRSLVDRSSAPEEIENCIEYFRGKSFGPKSGEQNKTFAILALVYKKGSVIELSIRGEKLHRNMVE